MKPNDLPAAEKSNAERLAPPDEDLLAPLLKGRVHAAGAGPAADRSDWPAAVVGELLALTDDGTTPLVRFEGQPGHGAIAARSSVDLHGAHIGQPVLLLFEHGDPARPIVSGVLRGRTGWPQAEAPAQVAVDADGERLIVSAREQLVLRCGKASITLTKAGKVLIEGSYLLSRSTGANRIKGGSVQLN